MKRIRDRRSELRTAITQAGQISTETYTVHKELRDKGALVGIAQDDYDDGIQTLVLKYEDGSKETVQRIWPTLQYRGESEGTSAHELFIRLTESSIPVAALWGFIELASRDVTVSTEGFSLFGSNGPSKPGDKKNAWKTYKKTFLNPNWAKEQTFRETVALKKHRASGFIGSDEKILALSDLTKVIDVISKMAVNDLLDQKINEAALSVLSTSKPYDVDKAKVLLSIAFNKEIVSLLPRSIPGGYKTPVTPLDSESWKQGKVEFNEEVPAVSETEISKYAQLVLDCYSLEETILELTGSIDGSIWEGWEYVKNSSFDTKSDEWQNHYEQFVSKTPVDELEGCLKFIAKQVGDLGLLLDTYIHASVSSDTIDS